MELPYIRVGTTYYKKVNIPLISGDKLEKLIYWSSECIRCTLQDEFIIPCPKFGTNEISDLNYLYRSIDLK